MEKVVGNGAFGIVWRAREGGSGNVVAIKKVILDRRYHNRELEMMKGMDHECVIKLLNHFEKQSPRARNVVTALCTWPARARATVRVARLRWRARAAQ